MARNIVKAKLDIIFKKLFTDEGNQHLLQAYLSDTLGIPYDSIENLVVLNSEIMPDSITEKYSRMDIRMKANGRLINVEMQIKDEGDYKDRSLYYLSKLYSGQLKSGEVYGSLNQCISINIINFNLFDCEEYHSSFSMREDSRNEQLTDKFTAHYFELKKIGKNIDKNNKQELWLRLINAETEDELDMLQQTGVKQIQDAVVVLHKMSADEKTRELAEMREKALHIEATEKAHARAEGEAVGLKKGEKKKRSRNDLKNEKKRTFRRTDKSHLKQLRAIYQSHKGGQNETYPHHTRNNNLYQRNTDQCLHGRQCKQHNVLRTRNGSDNYRSGNNGNSDG